WGLMVMTSIMLCVVLLVHGRPVHAPRVSPHRQDRAVARPSHGQGAIVEGVRESQTRIGPPFPLAVESFPRWADVRGDGGLVGRTPVVYSLPFGTKSVELGVSQKGYQNEVVSIVPGKQASIMIRLRRVPLQRRGRVRLPLKTEF